MNKNSIVFRTSLALLLFFVLFASIFQLVNLSFVKKNLHIAELEKVETISKTLLPGIALNLSFGFDKALEDTLISLAKGNEFIVASKILDAEGNEKFSYTNQSDEQNSETIEYSTTIKDPSTNENLGQLVILYSNRQLASMMNNYFYLSSIISLISLVVLVLFVTYFYNLFKPLQKLAMQLDKYDPHQMSDITLEVPDSKDEIGMISKAVRSMLERIKTYSISLQELNLNLQKRVDEEVEKNRTKEQMLIHQSRMAAMGEMMGNIAHQWRQPLNALSLLKENIIDCYHEDILNDQEIQRFNEKCDKTLQYLSGTIDDFRDFFSPSKEKEDFNIIEIVESTFGIVGHHLEKHGIQLTTAYPENGNILLNGYPNEFRQVLINILNNAKDVLVERKIENSTIKVEVIQDAKSKKITIEDNAGGIDREILPKVFDPYFTTKFQSQGTGIGLYMSKMIVEKNMGGILKAENSDKGAKFTMEFLSPSV